VKEEVETIVNEQLKLIADEEDKEKQVLRHMKKILDDLTRKRAKRSIA
jgi:hypothetical protein